MSQPGSDDELFDRIDALERSNRRWKAIALVASGILVLFLLGGVSLTISATMHARAAMEREIQAMRAQEEAAKQQLRTRAALEEAERQRQRAEEERKEAEKAKQQEQKAKEQAQRALYQENLRLAQQALENKN